MSIEVDLMRLDEAGEQLAGEEPVACLEMEGEAGIRPQGVVSYDLHVALVSGELLVNGQAGAGGSFRCSRCAEWFDLKVEKVAINLALEVPEKVPCVDLTPEIREAIILAFPPYPVCREACKGLCSQCGMDLNNGTCSCKPAAENRWGELDALDLKD